ncbi:MAG: hypothetical protein AAB691_03895 [Patescibacteria group bacterium]
MPSSDPVCESKVLSDCQYIINGLPSFADKRQAIRCTHYDSLDNYYLVDPNAPENQWKSPTANTNPPPQPPASSPPNPPTPLNPPPSNASPNNSTPPTGGSNNSLSLPPCQGPICSVQDIVGLLTGIVTQFQILLWTIIAGSGLYSAYLYVWARGESENLTKAKKQLLYTVVATVIATLALGIPSLLNNFLGLRG